jgi:pilus assembly protein CpaB
MMNKRPVLIMAVAAAVSLATVSMAAIWLKKKDEISTIQVVVATRDLQIGTRLQPAMLETVSWPVSAPIQSPLRSTEQAYDRVINIPILRGEPILSSKLAALGQQGGLSSVLKDGKRAVTLKVNEVVGVAGFALPGNFVDVMANIPDKDNNPVSKIVLERIQVLAVAQDVASTENKPRVVSAVTLEVTPQEAEILDLARSVGSMSLVLRSQVDVASVETPGSRKEDLLQRVVPPLPSPKGLALQVASTDKPRSATPRAIKPASLNPQSPPPEKLEVIRGMTKSQELAE